MTSLKDLNGYGNVQLVKCTPTFMWTINNFCICHNKTSDPLKSPIFTMGNNDEIKWCIHLYPKGFDKNYKDYVSLFLQLEEYDKDDIKTKYKFSILNKNKEKTNEMGSETDRSFTPKCDWGFREFILRDFLLDDSNGLLPDNKLTIFCEIDINKSNIYGEHSIPGKICDSQTKVLQDLELLLRSKKFYDVTFVVNDKKFYAHKVILAARSPVFSAMFLNNTEEKQANIIEIVEFDQKIVKEMLRYIYIGKVEELHKVAKNLLSAADKYSLEGLKTICEDTISKNLNINNAAEILALADRHNASKLKKKAMDFIISNGEDITSTDGFKTMVTTHPHLIAEAFQAMIQITKSRVIEPPPKKRKGSSDKEKIKKDS